MSHFGKPTVIKFDVTESFPLSPRRCCQVGFRPLQEPGAVPEHGERDHQARPRGERTQPLGGCEFRRDRRLHKQGVKSRVYFGTRDFHPGAHRREFKQ